MRACTRRKKRLERGLFEKPDRCSTCCLNGPRRDAFTRIAIGAQFILLDRPPPPLLSSPISLSRAYNPAKRVLVYKVCLAWKSPAGCHGMMSWSLGYVAVCARSFFLSLAHALVCMYMCVYRCIFASSSAWYIYFFGLVCFWAGRTSSGKSEYWFEVFFQFYRYVMLLIFRTIQTCTLSFDSQWFLLEIPLDWVFYKPASF